MVREKINHKKRKELKILFSTIMGLAFSIPIIKYFRNDTQKIKYDKQGRLSKVITNGVEEKVIYDSNGQFKGVKKWQ